MPRPGFRTGIMLCYPFEEKRLIKWTDGFIIQPKLNGERCRAILDSNGRAILFSSEGNQIPFLPHINRALQDTGLKNIELDGELYLHGLPREHIHSIVSRKVNEHSDSENMQFHIFDIISPESQKYRISMLNNLPITGDILNVVKSSFGMNLNDVEMNLDKYLNLGYEGVVLRELNALYFRKRATNMMKLKPREKDDYLIVGVQEEISIQGVPKNTLGALWLQGNDNEQFKVGSGPYLTRERRKALWEIRDSLPGMIATIKYQELSADRKVPCHTILIEISTLQTDLVD